MTRGRPLLAGSAALAALLVLAVSAPAAAQGKGRGLGKSKKPPSQQNAESPGPEIAGTGVRHFGAWLDDATVLPRGKGTVTAGFGFWRSVFGHAWDVPSLDAGMGVYRRVQVGVTAPLSNVRYTDGSALHGIGDTYVSSKVSLVDPEAKGRTWGLALAPIVEILGSGSVAEGDGRVHWALPLTAERRFARFRAYGAAGYFSRGAAFGSGALEVPVSEKTTLTGALTYTRSLRSDPLGDALLLARDRWDATGSVAYLLVPSATVFASIGRTVSRLDENGASLVLGAGVSFGFQRRAHH